MEKNSFIYNSELKEKFIKELNIPYKTAAWYRRFFQTIGPKEEEFGTDIACITDIGELQAIFDSASWVSSTSGKSALNSLRRYITWCINTGVDGATDITNDVVIEKIDVIRRSMVKNPLYLQKFLNQILSPEDDNTIDNTIRCLFWMAFSGIKEYDAENVLDSDVDFSTMSFKINNRSFPIYREGICSIKKCVELDSFCYKHPRYADSMRKRVCGHKILRGFRGEVDIKLFINKVSKLIKITGCETKLTYNKARLSGIFYRIYESETLGAPISYIQYAEEYMEDRQYNIQRASGFESYKKTIASNFQRDYLRWKRAFNL